MSKQKLQTKIILTLSLILLGLGDFAPLKILPNLPLLPAEASSTQKEWHPPGTMYSGYLGKHFYKYTISLMGKYGIYDDRGVILYYPQFENIVEIPGSYHAVQKNGLWGVIDMDGQMVLPIEYDSIKPCRISDYNRSIVQKNGYYGWINQYAQFIRPPQYTYLSELSRGLLSACSQDGCGILSIDGSVVLPLTLDGVIERAGDEIYFSFCRNGRYGVIDKRGKLYLDCILPKIKYIDNDVIYTQNGKFEGLARFKDGKTLLEPVYQNVEDLAQKGYYKMKLNGKWGAVDINSNIIYPCNYGPLEINRMIKKYAKK